MTYKTIHYEVLEGHVGVLTLNRPEKINAINPKMIEELNHFWTQCHRDRDARVIVMRGAGERGFCSGLDLKEIVDTYGGETDVCNKLVNSWDFQLPFSNMYRQMRLIPQPIIAAVHGAAIGGGLSFSYTSDIRLASDDAVFRAQYINIGVGGADAGSSYFLWRIVGWGNAAQMILTGDYVPAQDALRIGLVSRLYPKEELFPAAIAMAKRMAEKSRMQLHLTKDALNLAINGINHEDTIRTEDRNQTILSALSNVNEDMGRILRK